MLATLSVFVEGWTIPGSRRTFPISTEDRMLDLLDALVRAQLVSVDSTNAEPRFRMLPPRSANWPPSALLPVQHSSGR